ncbi:MAG: RsmD family RNA methyltransferase [Bacteroidia bacterium]
MRIISGNHKGFRFPTKSMPHARPTTDRAKESLFNILNQSYFFEECKVLDLYSGLGSMAFEFCSRGCPEVTTVEFNRKSIGYLLDIVKKLEVNLVVKQSKVLKYLARNDEQYDIIFADPPYNANPEIHALIKKMEEGDYLREGGVFILEHQTMTQIKHPAIVETREYGQSTFSFFKFVEPNE